MMSATSAGRSGERRVPRSEITWPKGQQPAEAMPPLPPVEPSLPASGAVRALYLLALLTLLAPLPSSWVALATGGGFGMVFGLAGYLLIAAAVWRAVQVLRDGGRLAAPVPVGPERWLRRFGLLFMVIGTITVALQFFIGPIARSLFGTNSGGTGIQYFVVGVWFAIFSGWASAGVLLFEFSRMLGFERRERGRLA